MKKDWQASLKWNVDLFYKINSKRSKFLDKFYMIYFRMGKSYSLPIYLPFFLYYGGKKGTIHLIISILITGIVMPAIKYTFRHKRPSVLLEKVHILEPVKLKSFPSADSAYVFTLLGVIIFYAPWYISLLFFINAVIIAYGRIYMGAHFPLDVIVGSIIGLASGVGGYYITQNLIQN
ncbi:MAG: phosphatase PAP2 family protein [Aquificae bacterium]|nr:phosphatase PAP2 family protein [Aquificota bacterium]